MTAHIAELDRIRDTTAWGETGIILMTRNVRVVVNYVQLCSLNVAYTCTILARVFKVIF